MNTPSPELKPSEPPPQRTRSIPIVYLIPVAFTLLSSMYFVSRPAAPDTTHYSFQPAGRPILGDITKGKEVVFFYDYQCPYCKKFDQQIPRIKELLIDNGQMHLVYMQNPFIGPMSMNAAIAAHCVFEQGQDLFFKYHNLLFTQQGEENHWLSDKLLADNAKNVGANTEKYQQCIHDPTSKTAVEQDVTQFEAAKGEGTPQVYVAGVKTPAGGKEIMQALQNKTSP